KPTTSSAPTVSAIRPIIGSETRLRIATQATTTTDPTALARRARNCDSTITEGWARVARHKEMAGMVFSTRFIKTKAIASILKKREGGVAGSMTKARQTTNP